jgi:hypothetical protein
VSLQPFPFLLQNVAMACDVNGFSWGMADALYEAGVRYLSMNINSHHGGYPFNKPLVPFYWESPSGNRLYHDRTWANIPRFQYKSRQYQPAANKVPLEQLPTSRRDL